MKNNIVPAIIVALAILAFALISRQSGATQIEGALAALEAASQKKDSDGKSQIERIASNFAKSAGQGLKSGFEGEKADTPKEILAVADQLEIREIKIVSSQFKGKERAIGILKNNSDKTVQDIQLNVVFRDSTGALLDVSSSFARVNGPLQPSAEIGFEADRSIGNFNSKEEELAQNRSATAVIKIQNLRIVK